jgi:tetratricopeptide (TPR) repeat protein
MTSVQQQLSTAFAKHQSGDLDGAIALYREVLASTPQHPDALHMLGVAAQQKGNAELALKLIDAALALHPSLPLGAHNRSIILRVLSRKEEAMQASEQAIALDPHHAEAWKMRGILARELNDPAAACTCHKHAMELRPQDLSLQSEYALSLYVSGDLRGAYKVMQNAIERDDTVLPLTLANILKSAGYPERAIPYFRRARKLMPQNNEICVNEATALLQMGNFTQGFTLWERRPDIDPRFGHIPLWKGQPVDHLLAYEDQGLGDCLQFVRYISSLREKASRITLQAPGVLQKLLAANLSGVEVILSDEPVPSADARVRLASLPFLCGTRLETIPHFTPYLHAREEWQVFWRKKLAGLPKQKIGIIWGGNPKYRNDAKRSIAFVELDPLVKTGGAHLVSLQKGAQEMQLDLGALKIFDAGSFLDDFSVTAGLLAELDLLITVDTATAHLAGAMGKSVWLLIPFDADWRWLLGREDSPWYPGLRLFRQTAPGDWAGVVAKAADELRKFLAGDMNVLKPPLWNRLPVRQNPHAIELGGD